MQPPPVLVVVVVVVVEVVVVPVPELEVVVLPPSLVNWEKKDQVSGEMYVLVALPLPWS